MHKVNGKNGCCLLQIMREDLGLQDVVIDEGSIHMAATSLNLSAELWESNFH